MRYHISCSEWHSNPPFEWLNVTRQPFWSAQFMGGWSPTIYLHIKQMCRRKKGIQGNSYQGVLWHRFQCLVLQLFIPVRFPLARSSFCCRKPTLLVRRTPRGCALATWPSYSAIRCHHTTCLTFGVIMGKHPCLCLKFNHILYTV